MKVNLEKVNSQSKSAVTKASLEETKLDRSYQQQSIFTQFHLPKITVDTTQL